jgi:acetate kinase
MRDLIEEADNGDRRCQQAIDLFCYKIKQYIGSYIATMNGCDAIIFTAGIGENSPLIRQESLAGMDYLGIEVDVEKNNNAERGVCQKISTESSKTDVFVIPTNEELVIAIDTAKIAQASDQSPWV